MAGAPVVLLVEDHPDTAEIVREVLEQAGYAVVTYDGGRGALDAVALHRPAVVVLDLRLPDLDGREVLRGLAGLPTGAPAAGGLTAEPRRLDPLHAIGEVLSCAPGRLHRFSTDSTGGSTHAGPRKA